MTYQPLFVCMYSPIARGSTRQTEADETDAYVSSVVVQVLTFSCMFASSEAIRRFRVDHTENLLPDPAAVGLDLVEAADMAGLYADEVLPVENRCEVSSVKGAR
jgi:hypothetical protein